MVGTLFRSDETFQWMGWIFVTNVVSSLIYLTCVVAGETGLWGTEWGDGSMDLGLKPAQVALPLVQAVRAAIRSTLLDLGVPAHMQAPTVRGVEVSL